MTSREARHRGRGGARLDVDAEEDSGWNTTRGRRRLTGGPALSAGGEEEGCGWTFGWPAKMGRCGNVGPLREGRRGARVGRRRGKATGAGGNEPALASARAEESQMASWADRETRPHERTERGRWRPLAAGLRGRGGEVAGPETGGPRGEGSEEERVGQGRPVLGCGGHGPKDRGGVFPNFLFYFPFSFSNQIQLEFRVYFST